MRKVKIIIGVAFLVVSVWFAGACNNDNNQAPFTEASNSSPIAITSDNRFVWVVNPDNDSVSVIDVGGDLNQKIKEIQVGDEPQCVTITPDDKTVYVTNMISGTVSVIDAKSQQVIATIHVGTEPFGCALTNDGKKLYVANFSSDDVSVINTSTNQVVRTISNVGPKPRGIAITGGSKVFVTQFLVQLRNDGRSVLEKEGRDDGKEGRVTVISTESDAVIGTIVLNPIADVGFKSNGSTLDRIPLRFDANGNQIFDTVTGAFPNLLQSVVIKGNLAYLPNTAGSPNGPFRFNVNVQGFLSVFDTTNNTEVVADTINMNRGINFESAATCLFITNPIAIAFKHGSNEGFVVSAATNRLVRVLLDATGKPTINAPAMAGDPGNVIRIEVGKNPRGIVINSTDTRAYVMNFISRDVSVVDITDGSPTQFTKLCLKAPICSGG
jgi:YVTN family beta-propeller protein